MIITRFAPSPTGKFHIGSARTALFNYLFAKHNRGKFILRIEDTDPQRSSKVFEDDILQSLFMLGIEHDEIYFQSKNFTRHAEVAQKLVELGKAYYCYSSKDEIEEQKSLYSKNTENKMFIFQSPWRDNQERYISSLDSKDFVIRFKTPRKGVTKIYDHVQGAMIVENQFIEDFVILRSNNTSTYMLAAVVDDHDLSITHVIRGDDHINNSFRQELLYQALGWKGPQWVHISLLHDPEGHKLSKRSGIEEYSVTGLLNKGYLADALRNYILRLGWSYGDHEIISKDQSIQWFNLRSLGKSPSKIDFNKLNYINQFYLKNTDDLEIMQKLDKLYLQNGLTVSTNSRKVILRAVADLKKTANNILQIYDLSKIFILENELAADLDDIAFFQKYVDKNFLEYLIALFEFETIGIEKENIKRIFHNISSKFQLKSNILFKIFRIFLTANKSSISVYSLIYIFGSENLIVRLQDFYAKYSQQ